MEYFSHACCEFFVAVTANGSSELYICLFAGFVLSLVIIFLCWSKSNAYMENVPSISSLGLGLAYECYSHEAENQCHEGYVHVNCNTEDKSRDLFTQCQNKQCVRCLARTSDQISKKSKERYYQFVETCNFNEKCLKRVELGFKHEYLNTEINSGEKCNINKVTLLYVIPSLSDQLWFEDTDIYVDDIGLLEGSFLEILTEFKKSKEELSSLWHFNNVPQGEWKIFYLYNQGVPVYPNLSLCPKTTAVLNKLKHFMGGTVFGYAAFSEICPGTYIPPHKGCSNVRVRCHLALQIQKGTSFLMVENKRKEWELGKCLVFDDSFLHSVQHTGAPVSSSRAVLLVDLWNPRLCQKERDCLKYIFSSNILDEI
ncbi:aspartate beta-hydroxylase domain-containing protein 2-like [Limulus polyphemus]|uniref:Aspartate beta-hydroxylase domain-containing protein 2-like n=1 Tax=Limulus polyphemus TaxID=6850 RepID=A0ABM1T284_LIMPO|nr:aspartate beta-hydroxylase domain-containing protein 2-like [Limulus polyphemus]